MTTVKALHLVIFIVGATVLIGIAAWSLAPSGNPYAAARQAIAAGGGLPIRARGVGFASYDEQLRAELLNLQHVIDAYVGGGVRANSSDPQKPRPTREPSVLDVAQQKIHQLVAEPTPKPPQLHLSHTNDTIFISIAAFRDSDCSATIEDAFRQAKAPSKVYMGVVEQSKDGDAKCMLPLQPCSLEDFCLSDNVRFRRIRSVSAKGPTYARFLSSLLYHGEKYFLMIDSHNRFAPGWDSLVVGMYQSIIRAGLSTKPVLSHYPLAYDVKEDGKEDVKDSQYATRDRQTTKLCRAVFHAFSYPKLSGVPMDKPPMPVLQPYASAGFMFAEGAVVHEVPLDPHLDFLFDGEEILYSVRLWTHGWDLFAPNDNIIFHKYYRLDSPKVWTEVDHWPELQGQSSKRVQYFLQAYDEAGNVIVDKNTDEEKVVREEDRYGLGQVRTLEEYWEFSGIDMKNRSFNKNWC